VPNRLIRVTLVAGRIELDVFENAEIVNSHAHTHNLTPLRHRKHHVFLSHAHVDLEAVLRLKDFLETAGLVVWFDRDKVQGGKAFPKALADGVNESQALIVAVSESSLSSRWVEKEVNQGLVHQAAFPSFPVIPVRLDGSQIPNELVAHSAIDAENGRLSIFEAARLLRSIHGLPDLTPSYDLKTQIVQYLSSVAGETTSPLESVRVPILYVTCGWRAAKNEITMRTSICESLTREGFHLIGDAEDHKHTLRDRIHALMAGCSGHLILLPKRGNAAPLDDAEYTSIRSEIEIGKAAGLKQFWILESGLSPTAEMANALVMDLTSDATTRNSMDLLPSWASDLLNEVQSPKRPAFVFVATDYEDLVVKDDVVKHISHITGLPCLKGSDFGRQSPSRKIEAAIRLASVVIANVVSKCTPAGDPDVNWNTCIEAGIALGAGTPIQIVARRQAGESWMIKDSLPFMLRDHSIGTYADDQNLMALIHKSVRPFRRRILGR
jgi:hypothetical protein